MNINYLKNSEIDKEKWDECISNSVNGIVYAMSWYLDIICEDWEALVDDEYHTIMPLTGNKKHGQYYLYQPFFTQQLGVFSRDILTVNIVDEYIKAIPQKFKLIEIKLNTFNKSDDKSFEHIENATYELDIISSYENIRKGYSKNTVRNIKRAEKNNITITQSLDPRFVIDLFRNNKGLKLSNLKDENYEMLHRIIIKGINRNEVQVWGAYTETNQLCAGAFFLKSFDKVIFLFSGTNELGKQYGAMPYLIDRFIYINAQSNLTLDFNGSNDENTARFYSSFGAKHETYYRIKQNRLPWYMRIFKR